MTSEITMLSSIKRKYLPRLFQALTPTKRVGCWAWLSSWFGYLCFQPCLYPIKTIHFIRLYTPPHGGVVGGSYPPYKVRGASPRLGGLRPTRPPTSVSGWSPQRKKFFVNVYYNLTVNLDCSSLIHISDGRDYVSVICPRRKPYFVWGHLYYIYVLYWMYQRERIWESEEEVTTYVL